jgi:hypothetical protein
MSANSDDEGVKPSGKVNDRIRDWDCPDPKVFAYQDRRNNSMDSPCNNSSGSVDCDDTRAPGSRSISDASSDHHTRQSPAAREARPLQENAHDELEPRQKQKIRAQEQTRGRSEQKRSHRSIDSNGLGRKGSSDFDDPVKQKVPSAMHTIPFQAAITEKSGTAVSKNRNMYGNGLSDSSQGPKMVSKMKGDELIRSSKIPVFLDPAEDLGGQGTRKRTLEFKSFG